MKVVLFCGGLGTRIREYSESIPKPMIPIGHQPILLHIMQYYSQYRASRFRPLPRLQGKHHQATIFLQLSIRRPAWTAWSRGTARKSRFSASPNEDWRIALIDTGIWRNIGQRFWAVAST